MSLDWLTLFFQSYKQVMAKKIFTDHRSEPVLLTLLGISCHSRDYYLTFYLNRKLSLGFTKMDDFRDYPFFFCKDDNDFNAYFLIGNRSPESVLIPELKQTDYLLLLEGPVKKAHKDFLLQMIRSIDSVLTAFEIRSESIKNFESVVNDLELHLMRIQKELKITYSPTKK